MADHPETIAERRMNEGERYMRFLLAGGSSALLNSATRWVLNLFMSFELAVALAYLVGMASAYTFMRFFAFEGRGTPVSGQSARFVLVNIGSFLQVWTLSVVLLRVVFPAVEFAGRPTPLRMCSRSAA